MRAYIKPDRMWSLAECFARDPDIQQLTGRAIEELDLSDWSEQALRSALDRLGYDDNSQHILLAAVQQEIQRRAEREATS